MTENEGERLAKIEEHVRNDSHRIDRLETLAEEIHMQNETLARLAVQLEYTNRQLTLHDERLGEIENQPRLRFNLLIGAVITALVSAVFGAVATVLFG